MCFAFFIGVPGVRGAPGLPGADGFPGRKGERGASIPGEPGTLFHFLPLFHDHTNFDRN